MNRSLPSLALLALVCTLAAGCSESDRPEASGKGTLVAVNAIVDAPDIFFRIEERNLGTVSFAGSSTPISYDNLSYTFNFDVQAIGTNVSSRLASRQLDVVRDTFYLFALGGSLDEPQIYLWEDAERNWDGTETVFELAFAHLNNELGPVDVYFLAPGVAPTIGSRIGALSNGERIPTAEFPAGDYVLTLTAPDAPETVLFRSGTRSWVSSSSDTLLVLDNDPSRTGNATVRRVTQAGNSAEITDDRFPPTGRVLHAAIDIGNVDLAENDDFANLIADNLAFSNLTEETTLAAGSNSYTFTDAGNQGAIIVEDDISIIDGFRHNLLLVGPDSEPEIVSSVSSRRPYATSGRIGFTHAASTIEFIDFYLLQAGADIADNGPIYAFVPFKSVGPLTGIVAGEYELTITEGGEKEIVAGPLAIDISNGDVLEVFVLETADPNILTLQLFRFANPQ